MLVHKTFFYYERLFYFKNFKLTSIFFKKYTYNINLLNLLALLEISLSNFLFKATNRGRNVGTFFFKVNRNSLKHAEFNTNFINLTSFMGFSYRDINQQYYDYFYRNFTAGKYSSFRKLQYKLPLVPKLKPLFKKLGTVNIARPIIFFKKRINFRRIKPKKLRTLVFLKNEGFFLKNFVTFTTRYLLFTERKFYKRSRKIFKLARKSKRLSPRHKTLPVVITSRLYNTKPYYNKSRITSLGIVLHYCSPNYNKVYKINLGNTTQSIYRPSTVYKYLSLSTTHGGGYILLDYGLIINNTKLQNINPGNLYKIRKKLNSFLEVNEYRQYIFNRRRVRILKKLLFLNNTNNFFVKNFTGQGNWALKYYKNSYNTHGNLTGEWCSMGTYLGNSELKISRIRFKPGYQRLWRNFRLAFAESINYKYTYQKQLTRYISKFFRKLNQTYLSQNENRVDNVLIYSKLVSDLKSFEVFFDNKVIYLNNKLLSAKSLYLYKNDFIQLEISNWYYIFSRWILNTVIAREKKFKKLAFRKSSAGKYTVMKLRKDRSYYIPKWITYMNHDYQDTKPFLEVDFLTLSAFMVYDYNNITYYTPGDLRLIRYGVFRLYNWKYIT